MKLFNLCVAACAAAVVSFSVTNADAGGATADQVGKLASSVKGEKTKAGKQERLCKKANLLGRKISLRSLNGNLCVGPVGAVALLTCKGYVDKDGPFTDSSCYKKAIASVGKGNPDANAKEILINTVKGTASAAYKVAKPLVCAVGPIGLNATGVGAPLGVALGAACGAAA